jgi:hypothetical protein
MMDPADTFGISWYPADPSVAPPPPPLKPGPSSNCFVYESERRGVVIAWGAQEMLLSRRWEDWDVCLP